MLKNNRKRKNRAMDTEGGRFNQFFYVKYIVKVSKFVMIPSYNYFNVSKVVFRLIMIMLILLFFTKTFFYRQLGTAGVTWDKNVNLDLVSLTANGI